MDKRIERTHRILGNALFELLQTQAFHQISIRQITDKADVAYSTFFRNFESIEDLLLAQLDDFLLEVKQQVSDVQGRDFRQKSKRIVSIIFNHVATHQTIYRILLENSVARPALEGFKKDLINHYLALVKLWTDRIHPESPPLKLVIHNSITQLFGMIEWWINQNPAPSPVAMADYYEQLVTIPTWRILLGEELATELLGLPARQPAQSR